MDRGGCQSVVLPAWQSTPFVVWVGLVAAVVMQSVYMAVVVHSVCDSPRLWLWLDKSKSRCLSLVLLQDPLS
eukprot:m.38056 g.38056  ORF g.38056 m.38056 type:complete len:72 (-) comp12574_c0_seq1:528-743(-)